MQSTPCNVAPSERATDDVTSEGNRNDVRTCQRVKQVACTETATAASESIVFAKLKYLNVKLLGNDVHVFRATYDTGTEVSVIRSSLLDEHNISYVDVGNVQLRPMAGPIASQLD